MQVMRTVINVNDEATAGTEIAISRLSPTVLHTVALYFLHYIWQTLLSKHSLEPMTLVMHYHTFD